MAEDTLAVVHGVPVLECAPDGPTIATEADATDLIGSALAHRAEVVVIPSVRLGVQFFTLSTGLAGQVAQKFVNYRLRLAVIGDIDEHLERSNPLRDLVYESNRGRQLWFLATRDELDEKLRRERRTEA